MTAALLATLLCFVVGLPLALSLPAAPRRAALLAGEAYLLGSGAVAFVLFFFSLVGVSWSRTGLLAGAAAIALAAMIFTVRKGWSLHPPSFTRTNAIDALTLVLIGGYARLATVASPTWADYITMWGLKAQKFWIARGIDWTFLESAYNAETHLDYPILLPLLFDVHALVAGTWPDRWVGVVSIAYGAAGLLIFREFLGDGMSPFWRAAATFAAMPLLFSPYLGLAEAPLLAYGTAGLLFLRRGLREDSAADVIRAAIYLGLAGFSKNEGLTLIAAAAVGMIAARGWRLVWRLWPAAVIAGPWVVLRSMHGVHTDLLASGSIQRVLARLGDMGPVVDAMVKYPVGELLFWIGVLIAFLVGARRIASGERFLTVTLIMQALFFLLAYVITPHDVEWHVRWSADRIFRQLMPALAFLAFTSIGPLLPGGAPKHRRSGGIFAPP